MQQRHMLARLCITASLEFVVAVILRALKSFLDFVTWKMGLFISDTRTIICFYNVVAYYWGLKNFQTKDNWHFGVEN